MIIRHDRMSAPRIGLTDESARAFRQARAEVHGRFFGEAAVVSEETVPLIPRIDIRFIAARKAAVCARWSRAG
jgi:hypothetical protein